MNIFSQNLKVLVWMLISKKTAALRDIEDYCSFSRDHLFPEFRGMDVYDVYFQKDRFTCHTNGEPIRKCYGTVLVRIIVGYLSQSLFFRFPKY